MNGCVKCVVGLLVMFLTDAMAAGPAVEKLKEEFSRQFRADGPGVAILVARDGKVLFEQGYGLGDRGSKVPVTPQTIFRIGSVTKQFTAAAILRLAEQGKLCVDDPLEKFFPGYPRAEGVLLRNMLNHTSGLHDYTSKSEFLLLVSKPVAVPTAIKWFRDDPPDFRPGTKFEYSNTNYFLLGEIVAKVSGQTLGDFLQTQFFERLGIRDTGVYDNSKPPRDEAKGYTWLDGKLVPAPDWEMTWAGGAGAVYSNVEDLWRWTEALQRWNILKQESLREMLKEVSLPSGERPAVRYGFGLYHDEMGGLPVVEHNGGLNGFLSLVTWFPDQKVTIVALSNTMPPAPQTVPAQLVAKLAHAFLADEMAVHAPTTDPTVHPKTFADFAGKYDYISATMVVTVENGRLFAKLGGQEKYEIFPSGPDKFFWKVVDARIEFERDASGKVIAARHFQNGVNTRVRKLP